MSVEYRTEDEDRVIDLIRRAPLKFERLTLSPFSLLNVFEDWANHPTKTVCTVERLVLKSQTSCAPKWPVPQRTDFASWSLEYRLVMIKRFRDANPSAQKDRRADFASVKRLWLNDEDPLDNIPWPDVPRLCTALEGERNIQKLGCWLKRRRNIRALDVMPMTQHDLTHVKSVVTALEASRETVEEIGVCVIRQWSEPVRWTAKGWLQMFPNLRTLAFTHPPDDLAEFMRESRGWHKDVPGKGPWWLNERDDDLHDSRTSECWNRVRMPTLFRLTARSTPSELMTWAMENLFDPELRTRVLDALVKKC